VSDHVRGWQAFKVIKKGEPYKEGLFTVQNVVLQSSVNCLYVRPVSEDGNILAAVSSRDGERETFKMITVHIRDKHFILQSLQNSNYVEVVGKGKYLKTVGKKLSPQLVKEKFKLIKPRWSPSCSAVCRTDRLALCHREQRCESKANSGECRQMCGNIARGACSAPDAVEACRDGIWDEWWGNYGNAWCE